MEVCPENGCFEICGAHRLLEVAALKLCQELGLTAVLEFLSRFFVFQIQCDEGLPCHIMAGSCKYFLMKLVAILDDRPHRLRLRLQVVKPAWNRTSA